MGDGKPVVIQRLIAEYQKIEIQRAWAPVLKSFPSVRLFDGLKLVEQGVGSKLGAEPYCAVHKIRLILWAHRTAGIKRRLRDKCGVG